MFCRHFNKKYQLCMFMLLALQYIPTAIVSADISSRPQLGINLSGPADWNTEIPFVNVFYMSRPWITQKKGAGWGKGPKLDCDEHGWVKNLDRGCWADAPLCTINQGHYPSGKYTVLYDGKGCLDVWNAEVVSRKPGRMVIQIDSSKGGFFLKLMETSPDDYIRNIRVIMPGFEETYKTNPWHPVFLERWKDMSCLRFMDFMHTNGSEIKTWQQRPVLGDATFSVRGVPIELMIDLCNRTDTDPWFCMPHLANDDYIRRFARQVKDKLKPGLKVYIEYSNEVWNRQFEQSRYAGREGVRLEFADKTWEAAWRYTAYRSVQIFAIWEEVYGGLERLIRVLPSQAANPYVSEMIVQWQDAFQHADAIAIAPYISFNISPDGKPSADEVASWTSNKVLDYIETRSLPEAVKWIQDSSKVAQKYGLKLIAYEGGQHMVGVGGGENNDKLTKKLAAANTQQRLGTIYDKYFAAWEANNGDMFCYFSSISKSSKWGNWGLLEYYDDDPGMSPKYMAVMRWLDKLRQHGTAQPAKEAAQ